VGLQVFTVAQASSLVQEQARTLALRKTPRQAWSARGASRPHTGGENAPRNDDPLDTFPFGHYCYIFLKVGVHGVVQERFPWRLTRLIVSASAWKRTIMRFSTERPRKSWIRPRTRGPLSTARSRCRRALNGTRCCAARTSTASRASSSRFARTSA